MADRIEHTADLALASFVEGHLHVGGTALLADPHDPCLGRGACFAGEHEALGELLIDLRGGGALDGHHVDLAEALARVGDLVDKIAVVGEEDQPFRVGIEASGGLEGNSRQVHQIGDLVFGVGVGDGGDIADGFMQGDVVALLRLGEGLAVNVDLVCLGVHQHPLLGDGLPIDPNATCCDQGLGASARRHSGVGDGLLQADAGRGGFRGSWGVHGGIVSKKVLPRPQG